MNPRHSSAQLWGGTRSWQTRKAFTCLEKESVAKMSCQSFNKLTSELSDWQLSLWKRLLQKCGYFGPHFKTKHEYEISAAVISNSDALNSTHHHQVLTKQRKTNLSSSVWVNEESLECHWAEKTVRPAGGETQHLFLMLVLMIHSKAPWTQGGQTELFPSPSVRF